MSANDLIEQLKDLPPTEQTAFAAMFRRWERDGNGSATPPAHRPAALPDFAARRRRIFGDKQLPENAVLAARREERW